MDAYVLEHIVVDNDIRADLFLPLTITRLQQATTMEREAILAVQLRDIDRVDELYKELLISWSAGGMLGEGVPLQERVITEWAAVGIACILMPLYTGLRILQVTQIGDGFDYWVGDDRWEYALEVSGTVTGNLIHRHAAKVRQLQRNPYDVDGYVAVTRFASLEAILSFNRCEEPAE